LTSTTLTLILHRSVWSSMLPCNSSRQGTRRRTPGRVIGALSGVSCVG
jgi:hypothetical protein